MLVPLFIALFYFSTKSQRRSSIFIFVTLGVGVGILGAIFSNYVVVSLDVLIVITLSTSNALTGQCRHSSA